VRALQEDGRVNTAATRMLPSVDPRPGAVGDHELLVRLRAREESAFVTLIDSYGSVPLRIAMAYVPTRAVAEEVVQETWLGVLDGIDRFEGRSSLKHWVFRILTNTAKTRAIRERRSTPFSALAQGDGSNRAADEAEWRALGPAAHPTPEEGLLSGELLDMIVAAIERLPPSQRAVIALRDIDGRPSREVCEALALSKANQRVLLHRARSTVQGTLERYLDAVEPATARSGGEACED